MTIEEIKKKIYKTNDWKEKGDLIKEAFKLSSLTVKTVVPAEKHQIIDDIVEYLIANRGNGWFCDNQQSLIITVAGKQEITKYAVDWVNKAITAGMKF